MNGYRSPEVCRLAGVTYRQLCYWSQTNLVVPSVRETKGSGYWRVYSIDDVMAVRVVALLLDAGLSLQRVRRLLPQLKEAITPGALSVALPLSSFAELVVDLVALRSEVRSAA